MERKEAVEQIAKLCSEAILHFYEDEKIACGQVSTWKDTNHDEDFRANFLVKLNGKNYKVLVVAYKY